MTNTSPYPRVLIVAGSDSGGGAGIQADIKTCAAFGVYSATAVTAITVQNTLGVQGFEAMSAQMVRDQMVAVLSDIGADVIKIGMLANAEIINAVADVLDAHAPDTTVVLDPVMVATSGDALLEADAIDALIERLIPHADVITPNVPEAERLTGLTIEDADAMRAAGDKLIEMGAFAAVMKGGHLSGNTIIDLLVTEQGMAMMTGPRLQSRHTHGTGCTLASAIAAGLARGGDLGEALEASVQDARDFVFEAINSAPKLGSGGKGTHGPLNHGLVPRQIDGEGDDSPPPLTPGNESGKNPFAVLKSLKP